MHDVVLKIIQSEGTYCCIQSSSVWSSQLQRNCYKNKYQLDEIITTFKNMQELSTYLYIEKVKPNEITNILIFAFHIFFISIRISRGRGHTSTLRLINHKVWDQNIFLQKQVIHQIWTLSVKLSIEFLHSFTQSFIHLLIHSLTHSFIHSFIHSFNYSFIYSFIHSTFMIPRQHSFMHS